MKRLHVHLTVNELPESIKFYSAMFASSPTTEHSDYAKWDLKEPAVNFAISTKGNDAGLNHLGIQVDSGDELETIASQLSNAEITTAEQGDTACCYANSNKHWAQDPQGIAWEAFHTMGQIEVYGADKSDNGTVCCSPLSTEQTAATKRNSCC